MEGTRPALDRQLTPEDFRAWYWLKEELVSFCQQNGLPTSGPKLDIADRVETFLKDGTVLKPERRTARVGTMPTTFTRDTVIEDGWRCTRPLREWFESEVGRSFRFTGPVRDILHNGVGHTLGEAADVWRATHKQKSEHIAPQLEYNRHMRAYFEKHPGATHEEAIASWWDKRGERR
ncbi:MAG: DUF6434 domain-containing protein [Bacteroidota bacterium]